MRKLFTLAAIVVFMLAIMTSLAMAGCSTGYSSAKEKGAKGDTQESALDSGEVINSICPVMGGRIEKDTPYKVEYDGKVIGFCCAGCVEKFNDDPEKYIEELGLEEIQEEVLEAE